MILGKEWKDKEITGPSPGTGKKNFSRYRIRGYGKQRQIYLDKERLIEGWS